MEVYSPPFVLDEIDLTYDVGTAERVADLICNERVRGDIAEGYKKDIDKKGRMIFRDENGRFVSKQEAYDAVVDEILN